MQQFKGEILNSFLVNGIGDIANDGARIPNQVNLTKNLVSEYVHDTREWCRSQLHNFVSQDGLVESEANNRYVDLFFAANTRPIAHEGNLGLQRGKSRISTSQSMLWTNYEDKKT